jgi:hypothetical protein
MYMKPLLIQLDEQTLAALNRFAASAKRQRSEFVRQAIRKAIRRAEYHAMREAYRKQPDSIPDADDWSTAEEYKPGVAVEPQ